MTEPTSSAGIAMKDEKPHRRAVDMSDEKMKEALKEALKEWLDEKAAQFGWFSMKAIAVLLALYTGKRK